MSATTDTLGGMLADVDRLAKAAEEIFVRAVNRQTDKQPHQDYDFTAQELTLLRLAGFEQQECQRECGRIEQVLKLKAAAGSNAERDAAVESLAEAENRLDAESGELEAAISEAQQRLAVLQSAVSQAQGLVSKMRDSRESLRELRLQPKFVRDRFSDEMRDASPTKRELHRVNLEIKHAEEVQKVAADSDLAMTIDRAKRLNLYRTETTHEDLKRHYIDPDGWSRYQHQQQAALPRLKSEAARLEEEMNGLDENRGTLLNYYVDQID